MLTGAYLWLILGLPVHGIVHQSKLEEVCLEQDNSCHLKLVHADFENGCEHDSHFKEETKTCEICVLLQSVSAQTLTKEQEVIPSFETSFQNTGLTTSFSHILYCLPEYRGPPVIS